MPVVRSVIVTGGASGIGLALARHFASEGNRVAILDFNPDGAKVASQVASEHPQARVTFHRCDVSSWEDQARAFQQVYADFGRVDVVMANAGIAEGLGNTLATIEPDTPEKPDLKVVEVDLHGVIYSVKLAIHYMSKNPVSASSSSSTSSRGTIICTASDAGLYPFPVGPIYSAAKSGVVTLVRSTAPILEHHKIQIHALIPAALVTNIIPDPKMYELMVLTPMETLISGVSRLVGDPTLNGQLAEVHDQGVSLRDPPYEYPSDGSRHNFQKSWEMFKSFRGM